MQSPRNDSMTRISTLLSARDSTITVLIAAALLRLPGLFSEWQYDEIWTVANFINLDIFRILTDLELPNNHPVNTLILKFLEIFSTESYILRLGVFGTGIAVVALCGKIAEAATGEKSSKYAAMLLAAGAPALILFSVTARGYIFQLLGLQLCIYALIQNARGEKNRWIVPAITGGGIFACLAVSSGIMFVATAFAGYLLLAPRAHRFNRNVIISGICFALFVLAYYLPQYSQLRTGQQWGVVIDSIGKWFRFAFPVLLANLPPFTAAAVLSGVIFYPVMRKIFLLTLLPLLMAFITRGGPERVYLILTPAYIVIAAAGFAALWKRYCKYKKLSVLLFAAGLPVNYLFYPDVWKIPAPAAEVVSVLKTTPERLLPVLPSTSGFPVSINAPEVMEQLDMRALNPEHLLMLHAPEGCFNGADSSKSEQIISTGIKGVKNNKNDGFLYSLHPVESSGIEDGWVLVIFHEQVPEAFSALKGNLQLNLWLNRKIQVFLCRSREIASSYFYGAKYYRITGADQ